MYKVYRLTYDFGGNFRFEEAELIKETEHFFTIIDNNRFAMPRGKPFRIAKYELQMINPIPLSWANVEIKPIRQVRVSILHPRAALGRTWIVTGH